MCIAYISKDTQLVLTMNLLFYEEVCVANITGCISHLRVNTTSIIHPLPPPEHAEERMT
jgi:hypothetical protein